MPDEKDLPVQAVRTTTEYTQFKNLFANRNVNKKHVQRLIHSFSENPALVPTRPILVNEKMEVIDGQHRLEACRSLGLPVYYMMNSGLGVDSAQLMNALQKGWSILDYARSYAATGSNQYQQFLDLHDEYPVSLTVLMAFCVGREQSNIGNIFRRGEFRMMKDKALLRERLDMLADMGTRFNEWTNHNFCRAAHIAMRVPGYDHDRMMRKLEIYQLKRQPSRVDYLRELETAYNYHEPDDKKLRFF